MTSRGVPVGSTSCTPRWAARSAGAFRAAPIRLPIMAAAIGVDTRSSDSSAHPVIAEGVPGGGGIAFSGGCVPALVVDQVHIAHVYWVPAVHLEVPEPHTCQILEGCQVGLLRSVVESVAAEPGSRRGNTSGERSEICPSYSWRPPSSRTDCMNG
jgi:hypothetical protein